jgi:hypothetical protein
MEDFTMAYTNKVIEWRSLDGKIYKLDEMQRWENTESYPYFRIHVTYRELLFADPQRHAKFLKNNIIDPTRFPLERFLLIKEPLSH